MAGQGTTKRYSPSQARIIEEPKKKRTLQRGNKTTAQRINKNLRKSGTTTVKRGSKVNASK